MQLDAFLDGFQWSRNSMSICLRGCCYSHSFCCPSSNVKYLWWEQRLETTITFFEWSPPWHTAPTKFLSYHLDICVYSIYIYTQYLWHSSRNYFMHILWHSIWHVFFWHSISIAFYSDILSGTYSEFPSGILFGIYSDILFGILSGICSGILCGIYSNILSGILSGIFSGTLSDIYSDVLFGVLSGILSGMCSGPGVAHCILSWRFGFGPGAFTAPWAGDMVFGSRRGPQHPELATWWEEGRGRKQGTKEKVAPLLKSRDPHLAHGEKTVTERWSSFYTTMKMASRGSTC